LAIHEQVVDSAIDIKRAESVGQFDLFGGLGGDETGGDSLRMTPEIPVGEWEKSALLAYEREMLGLYVSDHPLHGLEHVLAQLTDVSIAHLVADEQADASVVVIGGLVTAVQRKTTKAGSLWAIVTVEDLDGAVDVMVFPNTFATCGLQLAEDTVVTVKGRVDRSDDDGLRLVALEVNVPDLTSAATGPVRLSIPSSRIIPPVIDRLKEILAAHPGVIEVHLHMITGDRTTVMRLDDRLRVTPSPSLYGDLKALLGPSCLA
jgi:DNA polymerase-3 subunit alpha